MGTLSWAFPHCALGDDLLAGEMPAGAGQGPQNSLCSSSFQINRGCFMAANLKQFLGTKITEMRRVISQCSHSLARGSSSIMSNCLVWKLSTEHSLKSFASEAACRVVKQLTWFSLLEIWNALINLLHCGFCERFLMQMITPVEIKLLIGAATWPFPFLPMGCDTGNWSLCFKPFSAFPFHYLKQNGFSWRFLKAKSCFLLYLNVPWFPSELGLVSLNILAWAIEWTARGINIFLQSLDVVFLPGVPERFVPKAVRSWKCSGWWCHCRGMATDSRHAVPFDMVKN